MLRQYLSFENLRKKRILRLRTSPSHSLNITFDCRKPVNVISCPKQSVKVPLLLSNESLSVPQTSLLMNAQWTVFNQPSHRWKYPPKYDLASTENSAKTTNIQTISPCNKQHTQWRYCVYIQPQLKQAAPLCASKRKKVMLFSNVDKFSRPF